MYYYYTRVSNGITLAFLMVLHSRVYYYYTCVLMVLHSRVYYYYARVLFLITITLAFLMVLHSRVYYYYTRVSNGITLAF